MVKTRKQKKVQVADNMTRRGRRKPREITVEYVNQAQDGLYEKVLAEIYSRKVKNGTMEI